MTSYEIRMDGAPPFQVRIGLDGMLSGLGYIDRCSCDGDTMHFDVVFPWHYRAPGLVNEHLGFNAREIAARIAAIEGAQRAEFERRAMDYL